MLLGNFRFKHFNTIALFQYEKTAFLFQRYYITFTTCQTHNIDNRGSKNSTQNKIDNFKLFKSSIGRAKSIITLT